LHPISRYTLGNKKPLGLKFITSKCENMMDAIPKNQNSSIQVTYHVKQHNIKTYILSGQDIFFNMDYREFTALVLQAKNE